MELVSFSGGDRLKTYLEKLQQGLSNAFQVDVGFFEGAKAGWDGPRPLKSGQEKTVKSEASVSHQEAAAQVAFWMEYGTGTIPPRPFFSNMIAELEPRYAKLVGAAIKLSDNSAQEALATIGIKVKEMLQDSIVKFNGTPLAQSTIDKKGFSTPLMDSHNMINSIDYKVQ